MAIYRGTGGAGDANNDATVTEVTQQALNAAASAVSAATSASAASTSATNAATSESTVAANAASAATSAANAATSETNAASSETNADLSATNAASSVTAAASSATSAASSATSAASSATNSATSASAASTSETNAASSATDAASSATAAASSATAAAASESTVAASATAAASSASAASTSETNAASSATASATSATASAASETASAASATDSATSAAAALVSENAASTSAAAAATSETNAATSETNAGNSATAAAGSATAANSSAVAAASSASAASTSETNAATSATAAASSASNAAASYDAFDDRYLGSKATAPTLDNDGNALLVGALYFDTVSDSMKVYNGSSWLDSYASLSGALLSTNNLSDVNSVSASRTNLGLGTTDSVVFGALETTDGLTVGGDLTVNGTLTTVNTANLAVSDNMIYLNEGSTITNPDLGWAGNYNDGTYAHAGVFRDATDGRFKFYDGYTPEPGTAIDTAHASYTDADIQFGTAYGALNGNATTASSLATARNIQLTGDVTGTALFDGSANVSLTTVVGDDSHNHSTSTITGLDAALATYATLASPSLTGTPTAPTAATGTNTTQLATTAFVNSEIANDAPTKTGGGASGTWAISISGNAATASSATYATSAGSAPASDVYAWAKASTKPSYTYSEVGAAASSHTHSPSQVGLGNVSNAAQVTTTYNSSLNSDSRNSRGVTRLYRRDGDSDYSVQTYWTGSYWHLDGYSGDTYHAGVQVAYADNAGYASSAGSAPANGGTSSYVTINYNNNSASTYQMLWGSGNGVYGTAEIYCNPSTDYLYAGSFYCSNWHRSTGSTGWYNESYGGGIYMIDTTWVRVYNSKAFYVANQIAATGNITAYYSDIRFKTKTGKIENALDKVEKLEGFYYVENELAKSLGYNNDKQQVALSAQAVKEVMPEAVSLAAVDMETLEDGTIQSKSGENYLTVDYARLVPLLVEAIKELKKEISILKGSK